MFKNHTALASLAENDINSVAKNIEYSVFTRTTAVSVYKFNISKVVGVSKITYLLYVFMPSL